MDSSNHCDCLEFQSNIFGFYFLAENGVIGRFTESLKKCSHIRNPSQKVLERIVKSYSTAMIVACDSSQYSYDLYTTVRDLPETFTRLLIDHSYDIIVNGDANLENPNLLSATDKQGNQRIVKVLKVNDDARLSLDDRKSLVEQEVLVCEILSLKDTSLAFASMVAIEVMHGDIRISALVMPRYLTTVAQSAKFYDEIINREGLRLVDALDYMHSKQLVHMDVKGTNIFVGSEAGCPWRIGDFGSCRKLGENVLSTTYFFCNVDARGKPALPKYDWYMLLVAILIESLDDKHSWAQRLKMISSDLICDVKLKQLLNEKLKGNLRQVLVVIANKLEWALES
jgi:serine/threonine protein kinase